MQIYSVFYLFFFISNLKDVGLTPENRLLHRAPPKHQGCWACCSWVRCLRGVWKRIEHDGEAIAGTRTPCVWCGISQQGHHFRGLSGVTLTSAPAGNQTRAALARSKALNHYPVVAAYFWHVWYAGSSTVYTSKIYSIPTPLPYQGSAQLPHHDKKYFAQKRKTTRLCYSIVLFLFGYSTLMKRRHTVNIM